MSQTLSMSQLQKKLTKFLSKINGIERVDGTDFENHQIEVVLSGHVGTIIMITLERQGIE